MTIGSDLRELEVPQHRPQFFDELRDEFGREATGARHAKRRVAILCASLALGVAAVGGGLAAAGAFDGGPVPLETTPAAQAMANVFAAPLAAEIPASVYRELAALVAGAPAEADIGTILRDRGRVLLSNLGPNGRSIYAYPTDNGQVCDDITGLAEGCMPAFIAGEPAVVAGGSSSEPPESGPPTELAGLTKDDVTGVQVVVNGTPHDAVFGNDAWYYRFPDNHTPGTAATALLVTLDDGSTVTVPTRMEAPAPMSGG